MKSSMKTHEELLECSAEDKALFNELTRGLPDRRGFNGDHMDDSGKEIPYGSEAHVLKHIRTALEIAKPKSVLEIGFNRGHGSAMFLGLDKNVSVFSIDISTRKETLHAAIVLKNRYDSRFDFLGLDSGFAYQTLRDKGFDFAFVDGAHDRLSVIIDINLCKNLQVSYILFDDVYPAYGQVMQAIGEYDDELELIKDMDNLRLYKTNWK
jgi:predicted O-methyltransferase YrrM